MRITGTILNAVEGHGQFWVVVKFGRDNVLVLSTYLVQIMEPFGLRALGLDLDTFKAFAIKSRVHFRKGFDDNGFARRSCWSSRISRSSARCISTRCRTGMWI